MRRRRRSLAALCLAVIGFSIAGCDDVNDYFNLRNSFLNPGEVGRFDKAHPFGNVKPVKFPILDQLDVIDEPADPWANAGDPTPADMVPEVKEYVLSAGDTIDVSIFELIVPQTPYVQTRKINELGYINLQSLGSVLVSGLTPSQLEQKVAQLLVEQKLLPAPGPGQPGPQVNVTVTDSRSRTFSILGAVTRAGTYNVLSTDFRLLDALALVGDVQTQPGLDYIYVIRQVPFNNNTNTGGTPDASGNGSTMIPSGSPGGETPAPAAPAGNTNPLNALDNLEKSTTSPSDSTTAPDSGTPAPAASTPDTSPATSPTGTSVPSSNAGPMIKLIRPITTVDDPGSATPHASSIPAGDLDAALGMPATQPAPQAAPGATIPAGTLPADLPATMASTLPAGTAPSGTAPADVATQPLARSDANALATGLATSAPNTTTRFVFIDGRWVPIQVKNATSSATLPGVGLATPTTPGANGESATSPNAMASANTASPENLIQQRIIRIPLDALRDGVSKYNIVVRPGDIINVPTPPVGEFYMMGHVNRPGVYSLTGRKITLEQAVAASGNLDGVAIPRRCDLIRRIGKDQQAIVSVNLQKIFDGEQPDIFLKPDDVVNVGTDAIAPFLLITRNAYRASYGWGFVYDRNLYTGANANGGT
jgi:protein involved in polysaccharide export with SLBB domain